MQNLFSFQVATRRGGNEGYFLLSRKFEKITQKEWKGLPAPVTSEGMPMVKNIE